jgi:hypothetical protein
MYRAAIRPTNGGLPPANAIAMAAHRQQVLNNTPNSGPTAPNILLPGQVGLEARMQRSVLRLQDAYRPVNTAKAIDSKMDEYFQYINYVYYNDPYKNNLSADKVYRFMFFQAFREQKKKGGTKAQRTSGVKFDYETYDSLISRYRGNGRGESLPDFATLTPDKPTKISTFSQYKAMFRRLYKYQLTYNVIGLIWDQVWTLPFESLAQHVKTREPMRKKANYEEKVSLVLSLRSICSTFSTYN